MNRIFLAVTAAVGFAAAREVPLVHKAASVANVTKNIAGTFAKNAAKNVGKNVAKNVGSTITSKFTVQHKDSLSNFAHFKRTNKTETDPIDPYDISRQLSEQFFENVNGFSIKLRDKIVCPDAGPHLCKDSITKRPPAVISPWPVNTTVYFVPDLHGDFLAALSLLKAAELIDEAGNWRVEKGKPKILVQLGDIADRGHHSPLIYEYFWNLREQVKDTEDQIFELFGNHEIMNMMGHTHYISKKEIRRYYNQTLSATGKPSRLMHDIWSPKSGYLGISILNSFLVSMQIGDVVAVHAGLMNPFAGYNPLDSLTTKFVEAVLNPSKRGADALLNGDQSPIWTRVFSNGAESEICNKLDYALEARNSSVMIVGHTPTRSAAVELKCGTNYIMADTATSRQMQGVPTLVRVSTDASSATITNDMTAYSRKWEELSLSNLLGQRKLKFQWRALFSDSACFTSSGEQLPRCNRQQVGGKEGGEL